VFTALKTPLRSPSGIPTPSYQDVSDSALEEYRRTYGMSWGEESFSAPFPTKPAPTLRR
jgi:hypothetical protein